MSGISNHYDAIVAIQEIIHGLDLPGITRKPIIQEVLDYKAEEVELPCVLIAPYGPERLGYENNAEDGAYYGIGIVIVADADNQARNLEQRLAWRQTIRQKLHNHALTSCPTDYTMEVEPKVCVDITPYQADKLFASAMVVRVYFQELRPA